MTNKQVMTKIANTIMANFESYESAYSLKELKAQVSDYLCDLGLEAKLEDISSDQAILNAFNEWAN